MMTNIIRSSRPVITAPLFGRPLLLPTWRQGNHNFVSVQHYYYYYCSRSSQIQEREQHVGFNSRWSLSDANSKLLLLGKRSFSSKSSRSGIEEKKSLTDMVNPLTWWREREKRKEEEKYKERTEEMANKEKFTLNDMALELEESLNSWKAKLARFTGAGKELEVAKKMCVNCKGIIEIMGPEASDAELEGMSKLQKLKAANAAETTVEEINILLRQFETMSAMQRVLRKRKLQGKALPMDPEKAKFVVSKEAPQVLTKKQKDRLKIMAAKKLGPAFAGKRK